MSRPARRPPLQVTPASLRTAALRYLQRYTPTTSAFRRVMQRKIRASLEHHGGDAHEHAAWLDELVARLTDAGALDDDRWARSWADELHRRGTPRRAIRAKLRQKGVDGAVIELAIAAIEDALEGEDPDLLAARTYARRRRLGPYRRDAEGRRERRDKDLAAMGRAGFPWGLARRIIDDQDPPDHW